jgi:hypothetical protein
METTARPAEAQLQSDLYSQGRADSTFGGAQMGNLQAGNLLHGWQAGLNQYNDQFNQMLGARASFFGNEGQMAQNANQLNVQRGLSLANNAASLFANQSNNRNNFNLQSYGLMLQAQRQREESKMADLSRMDNNFYKSASLGGGGVSGGLGWGSSSGGGAPKRY